MLQFYYNMLLIHLFHTFCCNQCNGFPYRSMCHNYFSFLLCPSCYFLFFIFQSPNLFCFLPFIHCHYSLQASISNTIWDWFSYTVLSSIVIYYFMSHLHMRSHKKWYVKSINKAIELNKATGRNLKTIYLHTS